MAEYDEDNEMTWGYDDDDARGMVGPPNSQRKAAIAHRVKVAVEMARRFYSVRQIAAYLAINERTVLFYLHDPKYAKYRRAALDEPRNPYL